MDDSGLYVQLFSIHGLVRHNAPELGRDADTGGQVKYVLELAESLAELPGIAQVDLLTRLIADKVVSGDYARRIEPISDNCRIVRIQCGGRKYIRKELLWPHLDEYVDKTLQFIRSEGRIPDILHGHYADAGYVAKELASIFGVPFIFTGHSMGRHKKNKLLGEGLNDEEINRRYRIDYRIDVEERIIKEAETIITSTNHEKQNQYGLYDNYAAGRYAVIPPGIDIDTFFPYNDLERQEGSDGEKFRRIRRDLLRELHRFWVSPRKPFILALCRPDHRKNISGLITAYARDPQLKELANLAIFAGIRKDITTMEENEQQVLTEMLLLMDQYDLYGKLAIPKKHDFATEVPELYRLCADSGGIFVNPALVEPFGLTLIEAASCGVPIVATREGGPADIIGNCDNGMLIDPTSSEEIAAAARKIISDEKLWEACSRNGIHGVRHHYSWRTHCTRTEDVYHSILKKVPEFSREEERGYLPIGRRLTTPNRLLISDIDDILIGDPDALAELLELLQRNRQRISWGVSTGRCLEMTQEVLEEHGIPIPDILICSVGTEIYYGSNLLQDHGWRQHISYKWKPDLIRKELSGLDFLTLQEEPAQRRFKISYYINPEEDPDVINKVHEALRARKLPYKLVFSLGQYLDILPYRASKGKAVRYLSYKWQFPLADIMVAGTAPKDEEMLRGDTSGVVVANHAPGIEHLREHRRVYFSDLTYARGVIDGLFHYHFITNHNGNVP